MSEPERTPASTAPSWAVDLAITLVSVGVVLSLGRLFTNWSFAPRLVVAVVAAHAVAAATRRRGSPAWLGSVGSMVAAAIVISNLYLGSTVRWGLPTPDTLSALSTAVQSAFGPFQRLVAPVEATLGFQLALALGLWVTATFADAAINRADAPVQAVTPLIAVFLFGSVLARGLGMMVGALGMAAALVIVWLAVLDRRRRTRRWVSGDLADGANSDVRWGAGVAIGALAAVGVLSAFVTPGSNQGVVDLRRIGRGEGPTVVDSPLVGMTALLGARSGDPLFDVESTTPHYWRLTALETFDGVTWSSNARYEGVDDGLLPGSASTPPLDPPVVREEHAFTIRELRSQWLPAAFSPTAVEVDRELRYHRASGSLFLEESTTPGQRYLITSDVVVADENRARTGSVRGATGRVAANLLDLPEELRGSLTDLASSVTETGGTPLDQALALEQFFQDPGSGFTYDESVDYRGEATPMVAFLTARAGFCQQYASTFAAMARSLGLPARVAVGFTYGDPAGEGVWTVRGRHAHAWPEVFIAGAGWLAFEPTPGRGNPDAQSYTGRAPSQASAPAGGDGSATTTTTQGSTVTTAVVPTTTRDDLPGRDNPNDPATGTEKSPAAPIGRGFAVAVALAVASALGRWAWVRRRRRSPTGAPAEARVAHAWGRGCADLAALGVTPAPPESPQAFARRARSVAGDSVIALGELESARRYRAQPIDDEEADRADQAARQVRELVGASMGRVDRLRFELDLLDRVGNGDVGRRPE